MFRKFITLLKEHGIRRALKGVIHILAIEMYALSERIFDRRYHVETSSIIRMEEYDIEEKKKATSVRYQPTPIKSLSVNNIGSFDFSPADNGER